MSHGPNHAPTAVANCYAPHVGCPEPERAAFWQRLFVSLQELRATYPNIHVVLAGDSNLWSQALKMDALRGLPAAPVLHY